jgi:hypothetical protein
LALVLGDDELLEETTTPELEQVGIGGSQEPGGSQLSAGLAGLASGSRSRGAAAAAAGAAGGAGGGSRGSVVLEEVTTKQVLFPIFRPKSCRKCVILVRHGESSECALLMFADSSSCCCCCCCYHSRHRS